MAEQPIVTVDISLLLAPPPRFKYAIVFDKTAEELERLSKENDRCVIFNFYTGPPEDCPDCSGLASSSQADWIVKPFFIGNITPETRPNVIKQFVALAFGQFLDEADQIEI